MSVFFYTPWPNDEWLKKIKKKFKGYKIYTLKNNPDFKKIKYALVWDLKDNILSKMVNLNAFFSLGAGVDHILKLKNYRGEPIIRIKDPLMGERMTNYVLSQILSYQLNLNLFKQAQLKKRWLGEREPPLNENITIGILGMGFLGLHVGNKLNKLGYNVIGFKNSKPKNKYPFFIYFKKNDLDKFLKKSDIIVSILPATPQTKNFINKRFLNKMKKESLLINVGRGSTLNEKVLIKHLKNNKKFHASLDVFQAEPLIKTSPLWNLNNVTITSHTASVTYLDSAIDYMYKKIKEFNKKGKIKSDVNLTKGY
tara:strand:- start:102 stop:1031 length:930 start_codon:yes stop_codon:yes gene_type:complete